MPVGGLLAFSLKPTALPQFGRVEAQSLTSKPIFNSAPNFSICNLNQKSNYFLFFPKASFVKHNDYSRFDFDLEVVMPIGIAQENNGRCSQASDTSAKLINRANRRTNVLILA